MNTQRQQPARWTASGRLKTAGGTAIGLGLLFAKFKTALFFLLQFKWIAIGLKILLSSGSLLISIWFYAIAFGWKLGVVFVVLLAVHECGHLAVMRFFGVPGSLPYFIPGLGAFVVMKERAKNPFEEALIAYGGPFVGTIGAALCYLAGVTSHQPFLVAGAYIGFFLNLFNLIPVSMLDGGRIAGAISPRLWMLGIAAFVGYVLITRSFGPTTLLIFVLLVLPSIPRAIDAWRGRIDPYYAEILPAQRVTIGVLYFGLIAVLGLGVVASHIPHPTTVVQ